MSAVRLLRVTALALLFAMLFVPAVTQPARRLSPGPVNQGSSFSRVGVLSTDPSPVSPSDVVAETIDAVVAPAINRVTVPAPSADAVPLPTICQLTPAPLRAPPSTPVL